MPSSSMARRQVLRLPFGERVAQLYSRTGGQFVQDFNIPPPVKPGIPANTPVHTGAAIFQLLRHAAVLDAVEPLIGGEITSNPIQHARLN